MEFDTPAELKKHHTAEHSRKRKDSVSPSQPPPVKKVRREPTKITEIDPVVFQADLVAENDLESIYNELRSGRNRRQLRPG